MEEGGRRKTEEEEGEEGEDTHTHTHTHMFCLIAHSPAQHSKLAWCCSLALVRRQASNLNSSHGLAP
jgi:hypothetical protein